MSTRHEQSENNFYLYEDREGRFSSKIAYRKNLAEEISRENPGKFDDFHPDRMTDKIFRDFVNRAEQEGYKIYKLIRL